MRELCLLCGEENYIEDVEFLDAWQCWNCLSRWWLFPTSEKDYCTMKGGISEEQAWIELCNCVPFIGIGDIVKYNSMEGDIS